MGFFSSLVTLMDQRALSGSINSYMALVMLVFFATTSVVTINQALKGLLPFQVLLVGDLLIDGVFSLILSGVCLAVITCIEKTVNLI